MKKYAFTLTEVLIAMAIVGIIAGATINNISKVTADKLKLSFLNCYKHMTTTVSEITSDSTILPEIFTDTTDSTGHRKRQSICNTKISINEDGTVNDNSYIFTKAFLDKSAVMKYSTTNSYKTISYTAKNGSYWVVKYNDDTNCYEGDTKETIDKSDIYIIFDVNGLNEGPNCPYTGESLSTEVNSCQIADTFKFGITNEYDLIEDTEEKYNGKKLKDYLNDEKYLEIDKKIDKKIDK